jgi:hypothetical protein
MEHLLQAINYAMQDNVADMQDYITSSIKEKIAEKMQEKREEVAKTILTKESHDNSGQENAKIQDYVRNFVQSKDPRLKGKSPQEREQMAIATLQNFIKNYMASGDPKLKGMSAQERQKYAIDKFFSRNVHEDHIDEAITKSTSVKEIIDDFVHSDDPRLKGKSKEERIRMALGAYYQMHPEERKGIKEDIPQIPTTKPAGIAPSTKIRAKIEEPKFLKVKSPKPEFSGPKF